MNPVPLSVIVPCLNEAADIARTLDALVSMRERGTEVIVVDGGSSDASVAIARSRADLVLSAPCGRASQMNAGAARARGLVLMFLHADSRLPERADELVIAQLKSSARGWGRFDVEIAGHHPLFRLIATAMNLRSRWTGIATGDQAIFLTRALFERVGGFPHIALMEDVALTTILARLQRPLCLSYRVVTSGRRWQKHGVVRTIALMWRLRLAYWLGADPKDLAARYAPHRQR